MILTIFHWTRSGFGAGWQKRTVRRTWAPSLLTNNSVSVILLRRNHTLENYVSIYSKVVICRVSICRVRVWLPYRTYKSSGYGYASLKKLTQVTGRSYTNKCFTRIVYTRTRTCWVLFKGNNRTPGIVPRAYRISRDLGTGAKFVQNIQKFRVRVVPWVSVCACPTELTFSLPEVTGPVWKSYRDKEVWTGFPGS